MCAPKTTSVIKSISTDNLIVTNHAAFRFLTRVLELPVDEHSISQRQIRMVQNIISKDIDSILLNQGIKYWIKLPSFDDFYACLYKNRIITIVKREKQTND